MNQAIIAAPPEFWSRLKALYVEPPRHYHTFDHVVACLAELDEARHLAREPDLIEAALFFHDAVYDPRRGDNEKRSALLGLEIMESLGVANQVNRRVSDLVLATRHDRKPPPEGDKALVADVDLSVLGQAVPVFDAYESGLRVEHSWAPWETYCESRARAVRGLLDRSPLYRTNHFRERYEAQARNNLERLLRDITAWQEEVGPTEAME